MKKKITTWLLAGLMLLQLVPVPPAAAFSDVKDSYTAAAVESLRLMGVLDGYGDGTFRPELVLNRGQFCKMAVYAMDGSSQLGRYAAMTIFPDVKPAHWASSFINMAAKSGLIAGFADGTFRPGQSVTAGQAVTILMRGLGYKDEEIGGVWPQGYMAEAESCGLLKATGITSAYAGLTRGQAAKLFLNLFEARRGKNETLFNATVGKEDVYLTAVDGGKGTLTAGGQVYEMVHPVTSTTLVGSRGRLVMSGEKVLTLLPVTAAGSVSNAAVIIGSDGSAAGLEALVGSSRYTVYKNGSAASVSDLRRYDVATYSAATGAVTVCDTRLSVYYEDCTPSPANPTSITVLGGTVLGVLPTAVESLRHFKPGQQMTLLLTGEGQVAGAVEPQGNAARSNALAIVQEGKAKLICGTGVVEIAGTVSGYDGQVVSIWATKSGVAASAAIGGVSGELRLSAGTVGGRQIAENVLVFRNGQQVALSQLGQGNIPAHRVVYARTNWAGKVDLIVLDSLSSTTVYGRAVVNTSSQKRWVWNPDAGENEEKRDGVNGTWTGTGEDRVWEWKDGCGPNAPHNEGVNGKTETVTAQTVSVETPAKTYNAIASGNTVRTGDFVAVSFNEAGTMFTSFTVLTGIGGVTASAWIGDGAVTAGGATYDVSADVVCYNADNGAWTDLAAARSYGGSMKVYVHQGTVWAIEFQG